MREVIQVTATVSGEGYNELHLASTLTIQKADINTTSLNFSNLTTTYDGQEKQVVLVGDLPQGVVASYGNEKGTNSGTYNAIVTLSGANYNSVTLNSVLQINKATLTGININDLTVTYDGKQPLNCGIGRHS